MKKNAMQLRRHQATKQVYCGIFTPRSTGKNRKNRLRNARVILENNVARFYGSQRMYGGSI